MIRDLESKTKQPDIDDKSLSFLNCFSLSCTALEKPKYMGVYY